MRKAHYRRGAEHLYTLAKKREFEKRYGKKRGDAIFGATLRKVKMEQKRKRR